MTFQNSKNLRHPFRTPLYFKVTVICEYSFDFHEIFTSDLNFMEIQNEIL